jgi:peptide/nickel transport system permease protein
MLKYILRRLLLVIPTLIAILVISFLISRSVPGDPVYATLESQYRPGSNISPEVATKAYAETSHQMGLDLPIFYCDLTALAYPDTLHRVLILGERATLAEMVDTYGDWPEIQAYYKALKASIVRFRSLKPPADQKAQLLEAQNAVEELFTVTTPTEVGYRLDLLGTLRPAVQMLRDSMAQELDGINASFAAVQAHASTWKCYVPTLHFHGLQNQFHVWLMGILRLDFGKSYVDKRPVSAKIADAMPWSLFMGFFSFALSYIVAIPMGVYAVRHRNHWSDRVSTIFLFLLNSVPSFVVSMLALTFLCNPDYLQLFPTSSINSDGAELWPLGYRLLDYAYHLTLPTLIFSYQGVAFISRQMRAGMMDMHQADFIRTARAKGLPEGTVVWRHLLRVSILPVLTHFAGFLPALVSGGLITEFIFSIPGMGLLTLDAMGSYDHPVVIAVFTLTAIATLLGLLLTDILIAFADPRISFEKK